LPDECKKAITNTKVSFEILEIEIAKIEILGCLKLAGCWS
jgi:hypothetical protein